MSKTIRDVIGFNIAKYFITKNMNLDEMLDQAEAEIKAIHEAENAITRACRCCLDKELATTIFSFLQKHDEIFHVSCVDSNDPDKALAEDLAKFVKQKFKPKSLDEEELVEILADIEHERWNGWQEYLHSKCNKNPDGSLTIPSGYVKNLERLINTPYSDLIEKEKESDREEARKNLKAIKQHLEGK